MPAVQTKTVDFTERVEEIRDEKLPEVVEARDECLEEITEQFDDFASVPDEYRQTYEEYEERRVELEGQANTLERAVEEYGGSEWQISELTGGQVARIEDEVNEQSYDVDVRTGDVKGTPKAGYGRILTVELGVESAPPDAPTKGGHVDARELPHGVVIYLFDRINALNTVGDTNLQTTSLREAMGED